MKRYFLFSGVFLWGMVAAYGFEFEKPVRMLSEEGAIRVESPGYASPCWTDIDGDGKKDLLVGQFRDGKIRVYKNSGGPKLAVGEWLEAGGEVAVVPGVW